MANTDLKEQYRHSPIAEVQAILSLAGIASLGIDGIDGPNTQSALKAYIAQRAPHLEEGATLADIHADLLERLQNDAGFIKDIRHNVLHALQSGGSDQIMSAQVALNIYGAKDQNGESLRVDGIKGLRTSFAVIDYMDKTKARLAVLEEPKMSLVQDIDSPVKAEIKPLSSNFNVQSGFDHDALTFEEETLTVETYRENGRVYYNRPEGVSDEAVASAKIGRDGKSIILTTEEQTHGIKDVSLRDKDRAWADSVKDDPDAAHLGVLDIAKDGSMTITLVHPEHGLIRRDITQYFNENPEAASYFDKVPVFSDMGATPYLDNLMSHMRNSPDFDPQAGVLLNVQTDFWVDDDIRYRLRVFEENGRTQMRLVGDDAAPDVLSRAELQTPIALRTGLFEFTDLTNNRLDHLVPKPAAPEPAAPEPAAPEPAAEPAAEADVVIGVVPRPEPIMTSNPDVSGGDDQADQGSVDEISEEQANTEQVVRRYYPNRDGIEDDLLDNAYRQVQTEIRHMGLPDDQSALLLGGIEKRYIEIQDFWEKERKADLNEQNRFYKPPANPAAVFNAMIRYHSLTGQIYGHGRVIGMKETEDGSYARGDDYGIIDKIWQSVDTGKLDLSLKQAVNSKGLIVIDLGHGVEKYKEDKDRNFIIDKETGERETIVDAGRASADGSLYETGVSDPVGVKLARQATAAGYDVIFTRNPGEIFRYNSSHYLGPDRNIDHVTARAVFGHVAPDALGYSNSFFISLHANAGHHTAKGPETFAGAKDNNNGKVDIGHNPASEHSASFASSLLGELNSETSFQRTMHSSDADMITHYEELTERLGKDPRHYVGALVELGFLTNDEDLERLKKMRDDPEDTARRILDGTEVYHYGEGVFNPLDISLVEQQLANLEKSKGRDQKVAGLVGDLPNVLIR